MKTKIMTIAILMMAAAVFVFASSLAPVIAVAQDMEQVFDIKDLEGKWEIVSTTWGGEQDDFLGVIYEIDIDENSIDTKEDITEFIAVMNSLNEKDDGFLGFSPARMDNQTFCVMRYVELPNSYKLIEGYPRPAFWHLEDYPCAAEDHNKRQENDPEDDDNDTAIVLNSDKTLIRLNVLSKTQIRATIYYEMTVYMVAPEDTLTESEKNDELSYDCAKSLCYGGFTLATGTFDIELKKK